MKLQFLLPARMGSGTPFSGLVCLLLLILHTLSATGQTLTTGPVGGRIIACEGSASGSTYWQFFTVAGSSLTGPVVATAPAHFEISTLGHTGYGPSVSLTPTAGTLSSINLYVRSAASAPAGTLAGNVTLTSAGATARSVAVSALVHALPVLPAVNNQTVEANAATAPVRFTGSPGTLLYNWTNSNPSIGLPASGTGPIPSFTALNTTNAPVTATITATPVSVGFAYVANYGSNFVSVVNTATNTVAATIAVGDKPQGVAVSPDGNRVYVTNDGSGDVSVINTHTNEVTATVKTGAGPTGVAINPAGNRVYVTNYVASTVSVIDAGTNAVLHTIPVGTLPFGIAVSPDGRRVYVANSSDNVSVIDADANAVVATIPAGSLPRGIAVSPDGRRVYVTNHGPFPNPNTVAVINTATNAVETYIPVGKNPDGVAVSPDGNWVYVANFNSASVSVINAGTGKVERTLSLSSGSYPHGVSLNPDGDRLYVTSYNVSGSDYVAVRHAPSGSFIADVPVGTNPYTMGNFVTGGTGCAGAPVSFTITVNPAPATIRAGTAAGRITACAGSASVSPSVQQFTVSGTNLAGPVVATAPAHFEISTTPGGGYGPRLTLTPAGFTLAATPVYVRSAASAPAGAPAGNVTLSSAGAATQRVAVTAAVYALPVLNAVANQTVDGLTATAPVAFAGTANVFTWTNSNPSIGLPAGGTGPIPSFTALNTTNAPVTATITATPASVGFAYVANYGSNSVSVVNTATNTVVATIPVEGIPQAVAVSPDGSRVYVVGYMTGTTVISTATHAVVAVLPAGSTADDIVLSPDGMRLYLAHTSSDEVSFVNPGTRKQEARIKVGRLPEGICVTPDGSRLYVANSWSHDVSVINVATRQVEATVPVGRLPGGIAVTPDGTRVYVTSGLDDNISVIATATNQIIDTIATKGSANRLAFSPQGDRLFVTGGSGTLYVIDPGTNQILANVAVGGFVHGVSVSEDGNRVYVADGLASLVMVDARTHTVVGWVRVGEKPYTSGNFVTAGTGCTGAPVSFTITVNPTPPTILTGDVTGRIFACAGTAPGSPALQQFTASAVRLTGPVVATAPPHFEISTSPGGGYGPSLTLNPVAGSVAATTLYVRSAASAPVGTLAGNVTLVSPGARPRSVPVTGKIYGLPGIDAVSNQAVAGFSVAASTRFTGTGNAFTWTNSNPSIGLPAGGTGPIPAFTALNNTDGPVTATITVTPATASLAYASTAFHSLWVIDTRTHTPFELIKVGTYPAGVGISPDNSRVYVANSGSDDVSVIDTRTHAVINTIPVGDGPRAITFSPDGSRAYVSNGTDHTVSVINTATQSVAAVISNIHYNPGGLAVTPDGRRLFVAGSGMPFVTVVNTATNTVEDHIVVQSGQAGIVLSPDGRRLYAAHYGGPVSVVNTDTYLVEARIPVGSLAYGIAISPDGSRVYVANSNSNDVSVIDTRTNTVVATAPSGVNVRPHGVSVSADGKVVYTANREAGVSVIDAETHTLIDPFLFMDGSGTFLNNFISDGIGCTGSPAVFTITVNPTPPVIRVSAATGSIVACTNSASSGANVQQFTVTGGKLGSVLTVNAPAGFAVSTLRESGYAPTLTLKPSNGAVTATTVYVRTAAGAPAGNLTGSVSLSASGAAPQSVAVTATVYPAPVLTPAALPEGTVGTAYAVTLTGAPAGSTYTATGLPDGLTLSAEGIIAGTPTWATSSPATVVVTAKGPCEVTATYALRIRKGEAAVVVSDLAQTYDGNPKRISFTTTPAGLAAIVTYNGFTTLPVRPGTYAVVVTVNSYGYGGTASGTLTIGKAVLTVKARDVSKVYGQANPPLSFTYSGFVNGDFASGVDVPPTISTTAVQTSNAGSYPVVLTGGSDNNYTLQLQNGVLTVDKANQTITFPAVSDRPLGQTPVNVTATASSGLPVQLEVVTGPARTSGGSVVLTDLGTVTLQAVQGGNQNYHAAPALRQSFCVFPAKPVITAEGLVLSSSSKSGNQWQLNGANIAGATGTTHVMTQAGTYTVVVTGPCGPRVGSDAFPVAVLAVEPGWAGEILLYPNPATDGAVLQLPAGMTCQRLRITDATGKRVVYRTRPRENKITFSVRGLPRGLYLVELLTDKGLLYKKLILQ